jgi:hypothetical protein
MLCIVMLFGKLLIVVTCSYGKSDVEVAIAVNQRQIHVSAFAPNNAFSFLVSLMRLNILQVLIDIDYYKNRMQILALKPAPIQVAPSALRASTPPQISNVTFGGIASDFSSV